MCRILFRMVVIVLLALSWGADPARAHPHAWIDIRSTVIVQPDGRIAAIEQEWLFDAFYLAYATKALPKQPESLDRALREIARINLTELEPYGYFLDIRADKEKVPIKTVTEYQTKVQDKRLWLRFVVPLKDPIDPKGQKVTFSVFDPTYYTEILHEKGAPILFEGGGRCAGRIIKPTPSLEAVALASSLDRGATAGNTLGEVFAEKVVVECK